MLGAGRMDRRDQLPPSGRADIEQSRFCDRLAYVVVLCCRRLYTGQSACAAAEHQREADLLLSPGVNLEQAGEPRPDLGQPQACNASVAAPGQVIERSEEPENPRVFGNNQLRELADGSIRNG